MCIGNVFFFYVKVTLILHTAHSENDMNMTEQMDKVEHSLKS